MTLTGERLVDIAAERVRWFVRRFDPQRLYVFFSAGKDSAAALAAVAYAGDSVLRRVVVVYNELVGNTHPMNVRQAYRIVQHLLGGDVVTVDRVESPPYHRVAAAVYRGARMLHIAARSRHLRDFWGSVEEWGIPVARPGGYFGRRWCFNEFKEKHWRALPPERGNRRFAVVGVKASDSGYRRNRWVNLNPNAPRWYRVVNHAGVEEYALSPVLKLTDDQVWDLLREAGVDKLLETYRACGDSLNCVLCPFRAPEKQRRVLHCVARTGEGRGILERALEALGKLMRARPGTLTREKAEEWRGMILEALGAEPR